MPSFARVGKFDLTGLRRKQIRLVYLKYLIYQSYIRQIRLVCSAVEHKSFRVEIVKILGHILPFFQRQIRLVCSAVGGRSTNDYMQTVSWANLRYPYLSFLTEIRGAQCTMDFFYNEGMYTVHMGHGHMEAELAPFKDWEDIGDI